MLLCDNIIKNYAVCRGSYLGAHVLFNLLNDLGENIRCEAVPSILSVFDPQRV